MRAAAALVAVWLALAAVLGAQAPPADAPAQVGEVAVREAELERIRGQIAELSSRLDRTRALAAGLAGEVERLGAELELQERRVAEAEAAHEVARARVAESEARIERLESELAGERRRLESRVAGLYRLGRHGTLRLAFSLDPGENPVAAIRLLRYLARRDAASVERFERLRAELAVERGVLEAQHREASVWVEQQAARRDELARLEGRKATLLAGTRTESRELTIRAIELTQRAERLSTLLDALYGRDAEALTDRPIQEFRGLLDWPARGRVSVGFGPRLDPRYGTRVPHDGVDLATVPGEPVHLVYPGRVVYAADFEGYGPTVVVQHAGRAFTLYAGLQAVSVARDDLLSLNAVLGRAGETLYFEIRIDNRPEDPERWAR